MYNVETFYMLFFGFLICLFFDCLLYLSSGNQARWFKLHAIINTTIVGLTLDNVSMIFYNPQSGFDEKTFNFDGILTLSLHLYHCVFFKLRPIDYYHHGISVFVPIVLIPHINYRFNSLYYFTLSGFPGGINYYLLTCVKYKLIDKHTEKYFSACINSYIRMPLGCVATFYTYTAAINETDLQKQFSLGLMAFLIYANVCYFGKLSIENYGANMLIKND
jgi:hypothetical protein